MWTVARPQIELQSDPMMISHVVAPGSDRFWRQQDSALRSGAKKAKTKGMALTMPRRILMGAL
jgi:hypothetical protein